MSNEIIYTKYEVLIQNACDKYVQLYKQQYPQERTMDTAKEFMDKYYENYRKDVAGIGVDCMHEAGMTNETSVKIINQNAWSIGKLFSEIMKLSSDFPKEMFGD
jgi:hypothetical protein